MSKDYAEKNKYELLSKFESLEDFNSQFEQAMYLHKDKFTKSEYIALNRLRKFAADICGVAWCKIQKAVAATHKDEMFGVSRSSFERMLRKAKKLNLVKVFNQFKKHKDKIHQKHSVYVFNRLEELTPEAFEVVGIVSKTDTIDVSNGMKIDAPRTLILELARIKENKTYSQAKNVGSENESNLIDFKERKTEYQQIKEMIDGLFKAKNTTSKIYGVWLEVKSKLLRKDVPFDLALKAVKILIGEVKSRIAGDIEPLYNPAGYFRGIVNNLIDQWLESEMKRCERDPERAMIEDEEYFEAAVEEFKRKNNIPDWMEISRSVFVKGEAVPKWFSNRHNNEPVVQDKSIDFEAERLKFLAKLGS